MSNKLSSTLGLSLFVLLMLTNPFFNPHPIVQAMGHPIVGIILGLILAKMTAVYSRKEVSGDIDVERGRKFVIPSDETSGDLDEDGIRIGFTTDFFKPLDISNKELVRHLMIIGQSGVGKTTLINYMIWQQLVRGGGFIFIDAKLDYDTLRTMTRFHEILNIPEKLQVINTSEPENSNTYNPLLFGNANAKSARLVNLIPSTSNNAGTDFYTQAVNEAFINIFLALDSCGYSYTFEDLNLLLKDGDLLKSVLSQVKDPNIKPSVDAFLKSYSKTVKKGDEWVEIVSSELLEKKLGGMAGRITTFSTGDMGEIFNTYHPEVQLLDTILTGKSLYIMLPTMEQDYPAESTAKLILSDLRSAVAQIQKLPSDKRPRIPYLIFADEMGSYAMESVSRLFEQARSANISMIPALQAFSQLNKVSSDFSDVICQNCFSKVFFSFGESDNTDKAADLIGKVNRTTETLTLSESSSKGSIQTDITGMKNNDGQGDGVSVSYRQEEQHIVSPQQIKSLPIGECVTVLGDGRVHHLQTEYLTVDGDAEFKKTRYDTPLPKEYIPLNLNNGELQIRKEGEDKKTPEVSEQQRQKDEDIKSILHVINESNIPDRPNKKVISEVYNKIKNEDVKAIAYYCKKKEGSYWKALVFISQSGCSIEALAKKMINNATAKEKTIKNTQKIKQEILG